MVNADTILAAGIDQLQSFVMTFKKAEYIAGFVRQVKDGDLAIQRGMRMVYHYRKIDRKLFGKYRRRGNSRHERLRPENKTVN